MSERVAKHWAYALMAVLGTILTAPVALIQSYKWIHEMHDQTLQSTIGDAIGPEEEKTRNTLNDMRDSITSKLNEIKTSLPAPASTPGTAAANPVPVATRRPFLCRPIDGNLASELCAEMRRSADDLIACFHLPADAELEMEINSQYRTSQLDSSEKIFKSKFDLFASTPHSRDRILTYTLPDMTSLPLARVRLLEFVQPVCNKS